MISQPIYVQIADTIRRKVELGVYAYGSRLPTEREFSENFGVNRITVRKALKLLVDEGLLISSQGRGTFVSQPKISSGMDTIQGTSSFLTDMGFAPSSKMLHTLRRKAGYYFAKKLVNVFKAFSLVFPTTLGIFICFLVCTSQVSVGISYCPLSLVFHKFVSSFSGFFAYVFSSVSGQNSVAIFPVSLQIVNFSCPSQYPGIVPFTKYSVYV